mmetsp:Transcript_1137/g.2502  ORF Transcript_1137/g.2502 Transcript_1137/m.2502 type:complete len:333 (-) Transcript_1137:136-1134(-)|eukprot:CAMPEP_0206478432 /NCGR_PEP_ID=MMETSP0324_2-20121206/36025_1 /ASSEMBLY_ACC=CAM_ASM_000836 /TAXON_ID=2866 /ORGANISM="Crypthecodinium cohnii, Strain Seligo" /LENGTH=332 /DNA_ID=CAMNT_0053954687 /DNA_START=135 /DNA_END=1133 /DNA_ORIENTATION=+
MTTPLKRADGSVLVRAQAAICFTLAFLTGYVDIVCYLRWHAFATMMTGNVLLFSRNLAGDDTAGLLHLSIILAYVAGIAVYKVIIRKVSHRTALTFAPFLALCILLVELLDWWADVERHPRYLIVLMAPIFAVQTTLCLEAGLGTVTASVTAHTHNLMRCVFQFLICELRPSDKKKLSLSLAVILGVAGGAVIGAIVSTAISEAKGAECSAHPACRAAKLQGLCCPTDGGIREQCCGPGEIWHYRLLLVPVSPLVAITLIFYDYAFNGSFCGEGSRSSSESEGREVADAKPETDDGSALSLPSCEDETSSSSEEGGAEESHKECGQGNESRT